MASGGGGVAGGGVAGGGVAGGGVVFQTALVCGRIERFHVSAVSVLHLLFPEMWSFLLRDTPTYSRTTLASITLC